MTESLDTFKPVYHSNRGMFLLGLWILSLPISVDVFFELKPFDLIAFVGMLVFRKEISPKNLLRNSAVEKWSAIFVLCVSWGVILTFFTRADLSWMQVVIIRFYRFIGYIALLLIIRKLTLSKDQLTKLHNIVFLAALIQAVLIILQKIGIFPTLYPGFYSGTLDSNHLNNVTFMTVGIAVALGKLYRISFKSIINVFLISLSALAMAFAMVIGQARSAFVALSILLVCQLRKKRGFIVLIVVGFSLLTVQMVTDYKVTEIGKNIFKDRVIRKLDTKRHYRSYLDWDMEVIDKGRTYIWKSTLKILFEKPSYLIFGTGFQNFRAIRRTTSAHNNFLHILVELGLPGLIVFLLWLKSLWKETKKWKLIDENLYQNLSIPGIACLLTLIVIACFNEPLYAHRNSPGFLGFFLAYFAIITHDGWIYYKEKNASK